MKTLTGVEWNMIQHSLDKTYPPQAKATIQFGSMKGKTDIKPPFVRQRLDEVFGPNGFGWWIEPVEGIGGVMVNIETRTKDGKDQTWYVVDMFNYRLCYRLQEDNGSLVVVRGSAVSDSHDNMDRTYAFRGAMSSLMKHAVGIMGGFNHLKGIMGDDEDEPSESMKNQTEAKPKNPPAKKEAKTTSEAETKARNFVRDMGSKHGIAPESVLAILGVKKLGEFDWAAADAWNVAERKVFAFLKSAAGGEDKGNNDERSEPLNNVPA